MTLRTRLTAGALASLALLFIAPAAQATSIAPIVRASTSSSTGFNAASSAAALVLPSSPNVLIFGDSYTEGVGAVPKTNGWAYQVGAQLGWTTTVDGRGGSGYLNPTGYGAGIYADRIGKHPYNAYDLVVLQGSSNDQSYCTSKSCPNLATQINRSLKAISIRYPKAKVVFVGPTNPYGNTSAYTTINTKLKNASVTYAVPFIDPMGERWFSPGDGGTMANPDNGHPSNDGYQVIAQRFVSDITALQRTPAGAR